ncbi:glycosyltransferase family 4 protein [Arthrobacter sp. RT-1]|uniref:glycosyltransferase n=1 Tax=Arthrobacter sp. RT-1 TaxID=2292263 RepID=UPI000E1FA0BB|nr:glycosyltransferase [Arthrobacter sp. RT-1]RDV10447.1 glycosyltransferase family 4 protein [Arthrobacter sp. RT-1]
MRKQAQFPLRILVVSPPYYEVPPRGYGGVERVCFALVEGLVDRGHEVTLVGVGPRHTKAHYVPTLPVAPTEMADDPVTLEVRHALVAARVIRDLRPDIVHDHTISGLLSAADHPCPTVATVHVALAGPDSFAEIYQSISPAVGLVALSDSQLRDAPDLNWIGRVHNGIPLKPHKGIERKAHHVLYLGRISATKGVDLAIAAARAAKRRLVIAGDATTKTENDYIARTFAPLLCQGVEWVGEIDDARKCDLLAEAGCLILPPRWHEPFGLVVAEATTAGVPVVALRMGALPELLEEGVTGVLCDRPDELPGAINRAFRLPGSVCRARAERRFDARHMVAEYEQIYRACLPR